MRAKLNHEIAEEIRRERASGKTYRQLGAMFGVTPTTANRVIPGLSWRGNGEPRRFTGREAVKCNARCENCNEPFNWWRRKRDPDRRFCSRACNLLFANKGKRKLPDAELIGILYHLKRWSLQRIALRYGCCWQAVHSAMKRAGIKRRSQRKASR